MNKIFYIGRFTPTTGGVTAKNSAIFKELNKYINIKKMDLTLLKKGKVTMIFSLLAALCGRKNSVIVGTTAMARKLITRFLYSFNRKTMNRSVLMVMGGVFGDVVSKDKKYQKWLTGYKAVFVETDSMKNQLESVGLKNVYIFKNCRRKPETEIKIRSRSGELKCVCFSMIYPEKGIDTALLAAQQLPNVNFDFWGAINEEYKAEFLSSVEKLPNCKYHGVFKVEGDNVYHMLNGYDVLLFPTRWAAEGVPGTVVESKIAALPAIVTDFASNGKIVQDGINGIVMKKNTANGLVDAIKLVEADDEFLMNLKYEARESGKSYYFEENIGELLSFLQ